MKKVNSVKSLILLLTFTCSTLYGQTKLYPNEFPLSDVTLSDGILKHARDLNIKVLLEYDVDRLLAGYRKEAGLQPKAKTFPNWDGLDGHIAGHYLSAVAMNYAATGNDECKKRLLYIISELKACEDANAKNNPDWAVGYVGAVPNGAALWPNVKKGDISLTWKYWVPWYNVHKMYAGLRDAWAYTGNEDARILFLKFCDWAINITSALSDEKMEEMLGNEHGGMNEIFADAFQITGNQKYMLAAKRFSHKTLLNAMAADNDNLDNKHANTQVPKAIGFARIAELNKDNKYKEAADFFWKTVTTNRTLAFGGNSRREFFPGTNSCIDFINDVEGPESCNTYNMLKLTEDLFRINPSAQYIDFYEKALFNHILSTQHPVNGGYVYFTPARPRHYRVYSAPNEAMWCCVGSGMENHGKYNQFIYTHTADSLFLNLFIASELNWKAKGIQLKQETSFPYEEQTKLTVTNGSSAFSLLIRYPSWVSNHELKITVNNKPVAVTSAPGSFIAIKRLWKKGDVVKVFFPMHNTVVTLPNVPNYIALLHGPVLLAAKTGTEDMKGLIADDGRWAHIASGKKLPVDKAPILIEDDQQTIAQKLVAVKNKPLHFTMSAVKIINPVQTELQPFFEIHDSRYMMYWMQLSNAGYSTYIDSVAKKEQEKQELEKRTVDFIATGEQQPEADHLIQQQNSTKGNNRDAFWRDARNDGYFSFILSSQKETALSLVVRYWGNEKGNRSFDISVDDVKLVTENLANKWNKDQFYEVEYPIPDELLKDKTTVRVKFQAAQGNTAGPVYYIRLVRKNAAVNK